MTEAMRGRCLCGAVTFTATPKAKEMAVCHCEMCRRWTGGIFMAVSCGADVAIDDETSMGVYNSSDWGDRCFCKVCGSTLFWRMRDGTNVGVSVHAFTDPAAFAFTEEIFVDEQPANYAFANTTTRHTSSEMITQLESHLSRQEG